MEKIEPYKRFCELKKSITGISPKVLTSNLHQTEESGIVNRKVYAKIPPKVEYTLTELGYSLQPVLDAMAELGKRIQKKNPNYNVTNHLILTQHKQNMEVLCHTQLLHLTNQQL